MPRSPPLHSRQPFNFERPPPNPASRVKLLRCNAAVGWCDLPSVQAKSSEGRFLRMHVTHFLSKQCSRSNVDNAPKGNAPKGNALKGPPFCRPKRLQFGLTPSPDSSSVWHSILVRSKQHTEGRSLLRLAGPKRSWREANFM